MKATTKSIQIPDNAEAPEIRTVFDYYAYRARCRRRIERLTGKPLILPDEQGLPNTRRRVRAGARRA